MQEPSPQSKCSGQNEHQQPLLMSSIVTYPKPPQMEKYPATFRWFTANSPLQLIILFPRDLRRYTIQLETVLIGFLFVYNHGRK